MTKRSLDYSVDTEFKTGIEDKSIVLATQINICNKLNEKILNAGFIPAKDNGYDRLFSLYRGLYNRGDDTNLSLYSKKPKKNTGLIPFSLKLESESPVSETHDNLKKLIDSLEKIIYEYKV